MTFDYDAFMRKQEELRIEAERHQRKKNKTDLNALKPLKQRKGQ